MPQTCHPNAVSCNTLPTPTPHAVAAEYSTAVGAIRFNPPATAHLTASLSKGCVKDSGEDKRPTRKAREKLRVAREDRNMPKSRREKDLMSW
jgi:hypothetical protein